MWNRRKNNKNQFIGRRTGQNILPPNKELRKRDDGIENFQDYWTDSEDDTCLIAEKHVNKTQAPNTVSEHVDNPDKSKRVTRAKNKSPYKKIVTNRIEIKEQEITYDSSNHNYSNKQTKKNSKSNSSRGIQSDNQFENAVSLPDSSFQNADNCFPSDNLQNGEIVFAELITEEQNLLSTSNSSSAFKQRSTSKIVLEANEKGNSRLSIREKSINFEEQNVEFEQNVDSGVQSANSSLTRNKRKMVNDSSNSIGNSIIVGKNKAKIINKNGQEKRQKLNKSNSENNLHASDNFETGINNEEENEPDNQPLDLVNEPENQPLDIVNEPDNSPLDTVNKEIISEERTNQNMERSQMELNRKEDAARLPKKKKSKKRKPLSDLEIKSSDKENAQASDHGARRSHRQRHAPLKFWSNERLQYRYGKNGDIECLGVVCDSKGDQLVYDKAFAKKKKPPVEKIIKSRKPAQPAHSFVEKGIEVYDPECKEQVYANVVMPFNSLEWRAPKGHALGKTFEVGKSFMLDNAAFGFLRLSPMQTKPMQYLPGYDAVFVVMTGKVEVCINRTTVLLSERDTFYLPRGNAYSVTNLLDSEALLNFMATHDSYLNELRKSES